MIKFCHDCSLLPYGNHAFQGENLLQKFHIQKYNNFHTEMHIQGKKSTLK